MTKPRPGSIMGRPAQVVIPGPGPGPGLQPGPPVWGSWGKLPDDLRTIYTCLCECALTTRRAGKRVLLEAIGKARAEKRGQSWNGRQAGRRGLLDPIFKALESYGLIECHDWGQLLPMRVLVNPLPRPGVVETGRLELQQIEPVVVKQVAAEFITWWCAEWARRFNGERYRVLAQDHKIVADLLREDRYTLGRLKQLATHLWGIYKTPDWEEDFGEYAGRPTISTFSKHINLIATSLEEMRDALM